MGQGLLGQTAVQLQQSMEALTAYPCYGGYYWNGSFCNIPTGKHILGAYQVWAWVPNNTPNCNSSIFAIAQDFNMDISARESFSLTAHVYQTQTHWAIIDTYATITVTGQEYIWSNGTTNKVDGYKFSGSGYGDYSLQITGGALLAE